MRSDARLVNYKCNNWNSLNKNYCLFQCLRRKFDKINFDETSEDDLKASKQILWMCMSLALAPASKFTLGIKIILKEAEKLKRAVPGIMTFVNYVRDQWTSEAEIVSNFPLLVRTNNLAETFHRHVKEKLGGLHPNVWHFFGK